MSARGIITLIGLATFAGLAGLFAMDELFGPPYKKNETIKVRLPKAESRDDLTMESITENVDKDQNEQKDHDMQEMKEIHVFHPTESETNEVGDPYRIDPESFAKHNMNNIEDDVQKANDEGHQEYEDDIMFDAM